MISSRTVLLFALLGSLTFQLGCANIWHNLQPHRMNRLNRGNAPALDPEFSQWTREKRVDFAKKETATDRVSVSVNSPEVASVRAQSPERL